jgi:glycosyltransferase involved in cell wall biosynthesis
VIPGAATQETPGPRPSAAAGAPHAEGAAAAGPRLRLVHVTTVPEALLFLTGQTPELVSRGVRVIAISSPGEPLERFRVSEGISCLEIPMERGISPLRDLVAVARLTRTLRRLGPDVVDAHTPKAGLLGMIAAALAGVPVRIYHLHGLRFSTARGATRLLLRATERVASSLATRVLSVSHSVARVAQAEGLAPARKIAVLLGGSINGVDAAGRFRAPTANERRDARAALGIPAEALVIGFVGRVVREKGVVELVTAWRALRAERPGLRLLIVGPLEPHDPLPGDAAAALRTEPGIIAVGQDWDTPRYFRAMDVVALPSYREGFPVVPLEAAAMALPVVATRVPGCVDAVLDGVTGALVPARDHHALADGLAAYLDDAALRARHGAAARARVLQEFEQRRLWDALHAEYLRLASTAGCGRAEAPSPAAAERPWT